MKSFEIEYFKIGSRANFFKASCLNFGRIRMPPYLVGFEPSAFLIHSLIALRVYEAEAPGAYWQVLDPC
jgi:hypothetical protein